MLYQDYNDEMWTPKSETHAFETQLIVFRSAI